MNWAKMADTKMIGNRAVLEEIKLALGERAMNVKVGSFCPKIPKPQEAGFWHVLALKEHPNQLSVGTIRNITWSSSPVTRKTISPKVVLIVVPFNIHEAHGCNLEEIQ